MGVTVREKQKGSGVWWIFAHHNYRRYSRRIGTKVAAIAAARKLRDRQIVGEPPVVSSFAALARHWIEVVVPARCKSGTARNYRALLENYVLPRFGQFDPAEITRAMVRDFLLEQKLARSTVSHLRAVISGVMHEALEAGTIQANPAMQLNRLFPPQARGRGRLAPLTADELRRLLDATPPADFPLVLLLARTGMRVGEALALEWADIDWSGKYITVERAVYRGEVSTPKSGHSRRVDLSPQLLEVLASMRREKGLVFPSEKGTHIRPENWRRRRFEHILQASGLRCRVHDLRHTYATLRIAAGHNIADVSKQLGHHSVAFTLEVYYHWTPGEKKTEVADLDKF